MLRTGSNLWLFLCLSALNPWDWWLTPCQTNTLKYLLKLFSFGPIPAASDRSYHHLTVASRSLNWCWNFCWLLSSCWDRKLFVFGRAFYSLSYSALIFIKKRMKDRESRGGFFSGFFLFVYFPFWFLLSWICKHFTQSNDKIKALTSTMKYSLQCFLEGEYFPL